jgi:hypothetical protein
MLREFQEEIKRLKALLEVGEAGGESDCLCPDTAQ